MRADALSQYVRVFTPYHKPLRIGEQWYRLAAKVECVKCGGRKVQILRMPRFRSSLVMTAPLPRPDPNAERVMTSFMIRACDNMVGCLPCSDKGIHPCACGRVKATHTRDCPIGQMRRTGSFAISAVRSNMIGQARVA